jgi:porin
VPSLFLLLLQDGLIDQSWFRERGLGWVMTATAEVFSNVRGGLDTGTEVQGLLDWVVDADLEKLAGWTGAQARANPMVIEGHGLSRDHTGDLAKVSNIDARDGVRLFEIWLQQAVGPVSVRAGLMSCDQEFALSESSALFVNGTFGLPILLTLNAPVSAYPLGALGVRARFDPAEGVYVMAAAFEGSTDTEAMNRSGLEVRLADEEGHLWIGEAGWTHPGNGVVRLGGYYHSGDFLDFSSGDFRRGQHAVYGVVEQKLGAGLAVFTRAGAAAERNSTITAYAELGAAWTGFLPGRPSDQLGLAVVTARLSDEIPGGSYETVVEGTCKIVLRTWLIAQPDVQWIRHPGGFDVDDATVLGLRVDVLF